MKNCIPRFQSTRPSRASTMGEIKNDETSRISIHKALAGLDTSYTQAVKEAVISIHKALAGLDTTIVGQGAILTAISIHKALAGLDYVRNVFGNSNGISIHKALAGLDQLSGVHTWKYAKFQSTRPSRASTL